MVRSTSQSIKSGRATPNENPMAQTKSQSRSQSRRASISASLHKAYGEVKKKGLCKFNFFKNLNLTFTYFLLDNAIPTRYVVVFVAALGKRKLQTTFCLINCANKLIFYVIVCSQHHIVHNENKYVCDYCGYGQPHNFQQWSRWLVSCWYWKWLIYCSRSGKFCVFYTYILRYLNNVNFYRKARSTGMKLCKVKLKD